MVKSRFYIGEMFGTDIAAAAAAADSNDTGNKVFQRSGVESTFVRARVTCQQMHP